MKKSAAIILGISILFVSSFLSAQPVADKLPAEQKGLLQQLNLNKSQLKKFNELKFANRENAIDLRASIQKSKLKLKELAASGNITKAKLLDLVDEISSLRSTLAKQRAEMWYNVYNILDDTQKKIWIKHLGKMDKMNYGMRKSHRPMRHDCFGRRP